MPKGLKSGSCYHKCEIWKEIAECKMYGDGQLSKDWWRGKFLRIVENDWTNMLRKVYWVQRRLRKTG